MNIFTSIKNFFTGAKEKISGVAHVLMTVANKLKITDFLMDAAQRAVITAEEAGGNGATKFQRAVEELRREFPSTARGALQTVVQLAWAYIYGKAQ